MTRRRRWLALASLLFCAGAGAAVTVTDAWVREGPPGALAKAAYFTLHNADDVVQTLTGATSPRFARADLHVTHLEGGRVRMRQVQAVEIPAHGSLAFRPGGYHLMLVGARRPLKAGDRVELTLQFKDAPAVTVQAPVRRGEEVESADQEMHHHMDGM